MRYFPHILFFLALHCGLTAQEPIRLQLAEAVERAKAQSIEARQAATTRETKYWQFRTYQSNFKPQLLLDGRLPAFSRSFNEVEQPDGAIRFQPVRFNNSSLGLSLEQQIMRTGGTIYAATDVQRFDDFIRHDRLYNSTLFAVGIRQPLWQFNALKWDRRIEPLIYRESQQEYMEALEAIAMQANALFFDLLLAQVNHGIATTNLRNTNDILRIANEKFALGKISRNEILQLQLEQLKAEKALAQARRDQEIRALNLKSYIGLQTDVALELVAPQPAAFPAIAPATALAEAYANRADAIAFSRRRLEAERGVAKARAERGLNATLTANVGISNRGTVLGELYRAPQHQEVVAIEFVVPILDWGRAESRTKTAEANQTLTQYTIEQDQQNFRQEIYTEVSLFDLLQNQLSLTARADSIASEKYQIAQERYVLGNLSIMELSIAFSEKDQAKRDFVGALRDYWAAYYRLRWLTLYDFETGQKILTN
jgi:outer membrane protein